MQTLVSSTRGVRTAYSSMSEHSVRGGHYFDARTDPPKSIGAGPAIEGHRRQFCYANAYPLFIIIILLPLFVGTRFNCVYTLLPSVSISCCRMLAPAAYHSQFFYSVTCEAFNVGVLFHTYKQSYEEACHRCYDTILNNSIIIARFTQFRTLPAPSLHLLVECVLVFIVP